MTAAGKRIVGITVFAAIVCVLIGLYIGLYLVNVPGSVAATQTSSGAQLYLATVPAASLTDSHPTWVSYYAVDANSQNWQHKTTYVLPANTLVHVTIFNYDSASGLRNNWFGQSTGTVGGVITLNGKTTPGIDPDNASHVFSIPQIGLAVPLEGISATAKNPCSNAPCSLSYDHTVDLIHVPHARQGPVPLAVLRAVRRRIHRWVRRPDADRRVHGRLYQGRMSERVGR